MTALHVRAVVLPGDEERDLWIVNGRIRTERVAGAEFERDMTELGITFVRPDRRDETRRFGTLALIRQRIESIINTAKRQLSLEQHGARTAAGVMARVAQRILALARVFHAE